MKCCRRPTPRESRCRVALLYFSHKRRTFFTTNHDGRTKKTQFPTVSHPTLPTTTIPSTSPHFSIKSFDYLLRRLLHGTAKRHNYTLPYGVNTAKRNAPVFILRGVLPIFNSPPTLDNPRSTLPITQNGHLTPTNNHGRKNTTSFSNTFTAIRSQRRQMGNAPVFILGIYCPFSSLGSTTLRNLTFTLPITQKTDYNSKMGN